MPAFRRLAGAYTVDELGNWLGDVALAVVVYDRTGSALATAALFLAARFAPALAAPALAAWLEPRGRRGLAGAYAAEAAMFACLAVAVSGGAALGWLLALAAVDGALALAGRSLVRGRTAGLFPDPARLRGANAVLNLGMTGAAALGPAVAGLLVAGVGAPGALWLDAASFALAALLLAGLPEGRSEAGRRDALGALGRVVESLRYVRARPRLAALLGVQAFALVAFTAVLPVEIVLAKGVLGVGDAGYGAMLAAWGVGMVTGGALFAGARRASLEWLLVAGTAAIALAYAVMAGAPGLAVACVGAAAGGVGNGLQWVALVSALQVETEQGFQARVMALLESVGAVAPGLGFAAGGVLGATLGARTVFAAAAAGAALAAGCFAVSLARRQGLRPATGEGRPDGRLSEEWS